MTRILIVEDSPTQAEALRIVLETEGFAVEIAGNGIEGLERITDSRFDAVISDILMPSMSGYAFCRAAKASPATKDVPVMLLTTLSDPMDIIRGLECGADNFITKPYDPAALVARVESMLRNKRMRAESNLELGIEIYFLDRKFTIDSDKQQILDLLVSTFEDIIRTNRELRAREADLAAAKAKIEDYAKKLESRVRLSEEKYRSLMEHAKDAIFVIDAEGTTLEVNRQTEQLLDRPLTDIVGRPYHEFVMPAERDYATVQFQKLLLEGQANIRELHLQRRDTGFVCTDLSASLVPSEGPGIVLAIARDMTERNRLQNQVVQNEKLVTVGTLAAGIAHEINNPAATLLANLTVLDGPDPKLVQSTAEFGEVVRDCIHAAERIRDIVRSLKGFAHIDDGDLRFVNVNERIDLTLRMALTEVRHRARIEKDLSPDLPLIVASPGKLSQVFLNLIVNAAQAIEEGKVDENEITLTTRLDQDRIVVDISDTGKGIPADILPKIFDPFFTTKSVGVGTGLGLAICRDIVEKHNGEIRVASEVGRGTTFSVHLPRETGLELPRKPTPRSSRAPRSNLMVIDDDPSLLRAYQRMLGARHRVTPALGGRAAVEFLASMGPSYDVLLCDLMMPDLDGVDLHRYVAEKFPGLERRMVFISGGAFTARARDFLARVDNPRLEKPYVMDELDRAITTVLARR